MILHSVFKIWLASNRAISKMVINIYEIISIPIPNILSSLSMKKMDVEMAVTITIRVRMSATMWLYCNVYMIPVENTWSEFLDRVCLRACYSLKHRHEFQQLEWKQDFWKCIAQSFLEFMYQSCSRSKLRSYKCIGFIYNPLQNV